MNWQTYFSGNNLWKTIFWTLFFMVVLWIWRRHGTAIRAFTLETWVELKKCTWPWNPQEKGVKRYKELIDSTVVVVISSILLAGFVTTSDFILVKVIGFLTRFHT